MANKYIIKSATEQAAQYLVSDLEAGIWVETLPGVRVLAKHYGINHKIIDKALVLLEQWGWLEPAIPRKPRVIKRRALATKSDVHNLLILSPEEATDTDTSVQLRAQLALLWAGKYHSFAMVTVPRKAPKSVYKELTRLIKKHGADALVLNNLSADWAQVALDTLPTYFCGGVFPAGAREKNLITGFCASYSKEISNAYRMLRALGHRRIFFVYKRLNYDLDDLILSLPESSKASDDLIGLPEDYCIQVPSVEPSVWDEMWKREVELRQPTGLIVIDACAISSFYSYCRKAGKSIPVDYSILCLEHVKELDYLSPRPLMGHYDFQGHLDHFSRWLEADLKQTDLVLSSYAWDTQAESIAQVRD